MQDKLKLWWIVYEPSSEISMLAVNPLGFLSLLTTVYYVIAPILTVWTHVGA